MLRGQGTASLGRRGLSWGFTEFLRTRSKGQNTSFIVIIESFSSISGASFRKDLAEGSSVNPNEAEKLAKLSNSWWDEQGPFKPLHAMNKARCKFIKSVLDSYTLGAVRAGTMQDPTCIKALDIGCGGGILSESLATMRLCSGTAKLDVTGIDVHGPGIDAAVQHRDEVLIPSIWNETVCPILEYRVQSVEELLETEAEKYDVVIASEVIEHVDSVQEFCRNIVKATKPGGQIIISTLNRTIKSYLLAILGAEYITRMVPQGTHEWNKFITPQELVQLLCEGEPRVMLHMLSGMSYRPLTGLWQLSNDTDINYIASYTKTQ